MAALCPECSAELAAGAKFCPECGARQPERTPSREVRKVVTVLFADVTGSTALGEQLDPEALRALMNRYFARMRAIIESHGGTVEKFIGDAVMAVFGIPVVHEDDALRAVRAAAEIRDALGTMNTELEAERGIAIRFRTGVTTGEVVAGDPASGTTLVTGDTVNTAARLEQAAPPGEILLGRLTYSLVRDAVDAEPVEPIAAKGKAEPVEAFRLISVRAGAEGRARHLDAPMVGRDRELASLTDAWRRAVDDRTPHLVTLVAPAGVGKSRLVREFIERVRADGGRALVGRCLSYGEGITYWPVRELVHQAAGITEADDQAEARARIDAIVPDPGVTGGVASAVGLSTDPPPQEELFWAVRRFLEHLASEQPTLVVVEDLHWAEDTLLDLLDYVVDLAGGVPLLLLGTARPELAERRPAAIAAREATTILRLDPLGADAMDALLAAQPGGHAIPADLRSRILAAAEGNPLYVEELVGLLREGGSIRETDAGWEAAPGLEAIAVPASIQALLSARLEALPEPERLLAQRASVLGRTFEVVALADVDRGATGILARLLVSLVRKELLRPDRPEVTAGDAFRFRHVLIRDAAYDALPKSERAELHERFADWLEGAAGDRMTEFEEILAYHLEQSWTYRVELGETDARVDRLSERAFAYLIAASRRAEMREESATTMNLVSRARALLADTSAEALLLDLRLAWQASFAVSDAEGARRAEAVRLRAIAAGHQVVEARATAIALDLRQMTDDPPASSPAFGELLEAARSVVEASDDQLAHARYWHVFSIARWDRGDWTGSAEAAAAASRHALASGDDAFAQHLRSVRVVEHLSGPTPLSTTLALVEELLAEEWPGLRSRANLVENRGMVRAMLGDVDGGRADIMVSRATFRELGARGAVADSTWYLSWVARLERSYELEVELIRESLDDASANSSSLRRAAMALALAKLGRIDEAEQALGAPDPSSWPRLTRLRSITLARIEVQRGRHEAALARAETVAESVATEALFLNALAETLVECGVVASFAGAPDVATRLGNAALDAATRKQNRMVEQKARALLDGDLGRL